MDEHTAQRHGQSHMNFLIRKWREIKRSERKRQKKKRSTHLLQIQCDRHEFVFAARCQRWTLPPFRWAVNHMFDGVSSFGVVCIANAALGFTLPPLRMSIDCMTKFFARSLTARCVCIQNRLRRNIEYRWPQTANRFIGSCVWRVFHIGDKHCKINDQRKWKTKKLKLKLWWAGKECAWLTDRHNRPVEWRSVGRGSRWKRTDDEWRPI